MLLRCTVINNPGQCVEHCAGTNMEQEGEKERERERVKIIIFDISVIYPTDSPTIAKRAKVSIINDFAPIYRQL